VGHDGPFAIEDLYFLRVLEVPDQGQVELRVRLRPKGQGFNFEVHTKQRLNGGTEGWVLHAQAFLRRFLPTAPSAMVPAEIRARCTLREVRAGAEPYRVAQERHLQFGERWHNLRSFAFGPSEAIGQLSLAPQREADVKAYGLHPALLDIATGFAIELEPSYGKGDSLWVPVSYERIAVYADLTPSLVSHVRLHPHAGADGFARFDVTIADPDGRVLVEAKSFSMKSIGGSSFESAALTPKDLEVEGPRRELSAVERAFLRNLAAGITPSDGVAAFRHLVDAQPRARVIVSPVDVRALIAEIDALAEMQRASTSVSFERPALSSDFAAPENDLEKRLATMFQELLGVDRVGANDDFFELSGNSLVGLRLLSAIRRATGVSLTLANLLEASSVRTLAAAVQARGGGGTGSPARPERAPARLDQLRRPAVTLHASEQSSNTPTSTAEIADGSFTPLVPIRVDKRGLAFFCVHGAGGNVLNFLPLANALRNSVDFYGLQAKGVDGSTPLERLEDMAELYLHHIRRVQPSGPYYLGGYSGGGVVALHIAHLLRAQGAHVAHVMLLDAYHPHTQPRMGSVGYRLRRLLRTPGATVNHWRKRRKEAELATQQRSELTVIQRYQLTVPEELREQLLTDTFIRAMQCYAPPVYDGRVTLLKAMVVPYWFSHTDRTLGWSGLLPTLEIVDVPGEHNAMMVHPLYVAELARVIRERLDVGERGRLGAQALRE
jgi:thioesterase domain-containing protein/acyl carrier protein